MFDTFAVTGAYPNASSTGNVISVPLPTSVLIAPAATPARAIETTSAALITRVREAPASAHDLALNPDTVALARADAAWIRA